MLQVSYDAEKAKADLLELEDGLKGKAIRAGLTQAIKPILAQMKSTAPVGKEGALKRALGRVTLSKRAKGRIGVDVADVAILIGPNRKVQDGGGARHQGYKAIWLEYGTETARPHKFMGPAFDSNIASVQTRFFNGLQAYIDKVTR